MKSAPVLGDTLASPVRSSQNCVIQIAADLGTAARFQRSFDCPNGSQEVANQSAVRSVQGDRRREALLGWPTRSDSVYAMLGRFRVSVQASQRCRRKCQVGGEGRCDGSPASQPRGGARNRFSHLHAHPISCW